MFISAKVEQIDHLDADNQVVVRLLANLIRAELTNDLDRVVKLLRFYGNKDWFIYRGGNHVALHLKSGDDRRMLIAYFSNDRSIA